MSGPNLSKSESDVSSSSSWDVIDESDNSRSSSLEILVDENDDDSRNCRTESRVAINDIEDTFITVPDDAASTIDNMELPHLELPEVHQQCPATNVKTGSGGKKHTKTKSKGKNKRIRAEPLSLLAIVGSILTVTVLTTLCLFFPNGNVKKMSKSTDTRDIQLTPENSNIFKADMNGTAELLNTINLINMHMNHHENGTEDGFTDEEMCYIEEEIHHVPQELFDLSSLGPQSTTNIKSQSKSENKSFSLQGIQNVPMSLMKELRGVLMTPNFQLFLCTLMQDICLIKLVKQLERRTAVGTKPKEITKRTDRKKIRTMGNKLKLEISKKLSDKKKNKKNGKVHKLKKALDLTITNSSYPSPSQQNSFYAGSTAKIEMESDVEDISFNKIPTVTHLNTENGKSECERRFEDLDNKWETVGQNHRLKIQEIKEKFRHELHNIRENEKDFPLRKQKMKMIREKYLQRLRLDREKYLNQLRKLRDERHVVLKDICEKKEKMLDSKDASSGNHALLLPDVYDFQQKLQEVRKREVPGKNSHITTSFPALLPMKAIDYPKNYSSSDILGRVHDKKLPFNHQNYMDKMRKYYEMKNNILKRNSERSGFISVSANSTETITTASAVTMKPPYSTTPTELTASRRNYGEILSTEITTDNMTDNTLKGRSDSRFKMVLRKKQRKRELYDTAFDENGERIMKADDAVPARAHRNSSPIYQPLMSKQDPKPPTKKLFTFKGKL